jgi:hypothetical protein
LFRTPALAAAALLVVLSRPDSPTSRLRRAASAPALGDQRLAYFFPFVPPRPEHQPLRSRTTATTVTSAHNSTSGWIEGTVETVEELADGAGDTVEETAEDVADWVCKIFCW